MKINKYIFSKWICCILLGLFRWMWN